MENFYFAGGNTARGFINLYDNIIDRDNCNFFVTVKGGSGVGKSTLLKRVADSFKDEDKEYFYCTGDVNSYDGLTIPQKKIAIVDGTSPHVIETKYVKTSDYSVDLSEFIDGKKLIDKSDKIRYLIKQKSKYYRNAYTYLSALGELYNETIYKYSTVVDINKRGVMVNQILGMVSDRSFNVNNYTRKLFSGGITYSGEVYLENTVNKQVIYLKGDKRLASILLKKIEDIVGKENIITEYYSPINDRVLYDIEFFDTIITTNDKILSTKDTVIVDVNEILLKNIRGELKEYDETIEIIKQKVISCLKNARGMHEDIEKEYVPVVDFDKVENKRQELIRFLHG